MKIIKFLGPIILSGFLLACSQPKHDYQYLTTHPAVLSQVIKRCRTMTTTTPACATAAKAYQEVSTQAQALMSDMQAFGHKILLAQEKLAAMQQAYQTKSSSALAEKIKQQQAYIQRLLAITKLAGE